MKCPKCGALLADNAKYCGICGQAFSQGQSQYQNRNQQQYNQQQNQQQYRQQYNQQQYNQQQNNYQQYNGGNSMIDRRVIVNPTEQIVSSMQSSPLKTFLTGGGIGKTEMFFTNKRFYAKFKDISLLRGISNTDVIVDLEHITGTILLQNNPIILIVDAIIMFLLGIIFAANGEPALIILFWILAGIFAVGYFLKRVICLKVSHEGDSFIVPMKCCSYANADRFHKELRNYLDKIKK